jgi:hypothetical protein
MAKPAKQVEPEVTERVASKFVKDILAHYDNIATAQGRYMNAARRERDAMASIYEQMAARGVSQKSAKINVKIVRALEKIKGWMADLEADDLKMALRLAKAQKDKRQLMLFGELPKMPKQPPKGEFVEKLRLVTEGVGNGEDRPEGKAAS